MSTRQSGRLSKRNLEVNEIPTTLNINSTIACASVTTTEQTILDTSTRHGISVPRNVSPEKKKKKKKHKNKNKKPKATVPTITKVSAKSAAKPKSVFWDEIFTERAGPDGSFVVIIVKQKSSGNAGYIHHLLKALQNNDDIVASLKSETAFDCRISTTLFLRQSRDINKKVSLKWR